MTIFEALRKRIISITKKQGLTMYRLAFKSGLSPSTIRHIFSGDIKNIKLDTIYAICSGLDISIGELFSDSIFDEVDE